jgi:hypothetical protein
MPEVNHKELDSGNFTLECFITVFSLKIPLDNCPACILYKYTVQYTRRLDTNCGTEFQSNSITIQADKSKQNKKTDLGFFNKFGNDNRMILRYITSLS